MLVLGNAEEALIRSDETDPIRKKKQRGKIIKSIKNNHRRKVHIFTASTFGVLEIFTLFNTVTGFV